MELHNCSIKPIARSGCFLTSPNQNVAVFLYGVAFASGLRRGSRRIELQILSHRPARNSHHQKEQRPDLGPAAVTKHRSRRLANSEDDGATSIRGWRAHQVFFIFFFFFGFVAMI
jgi:hypothetical protein